MLVLTPIQTDGYHLCLASMTTEDRKRLEELLPKAVVAAVDSASHPDFTECARAIDRLIGTDADDAETGAIRRGIVATWMLELPRRIAAYNLPPEVFDAYGHWLTRLSEYISTREGCYDPDHWAMDVRIALGVSVPASRTHMMDMSSVLPLRPALRHMMAGRGISAPLRWFASGAWGSWLQLHADNRDLSDYNRVGWDRTWLSVAGVLERYTGLRGAMCSSWVYDPPLSRISPRLVYLRKTPARNGAFFIHRGQSQTCSRLASVGSPTRRAMIENGEYVPRAWTVVWPRGPLLSWAKRERRRLAVMADIIEQSEIAAPGVALA